ncbi:MAG: cyclase [Candidatus Hydrothermarchaeales archaeon]
MVYVFVRHKVDDYAKWKPAFDEDGDSRKAAGSKGGYVFRNVDDPNEVVILIEAEDLEKLRPYMQSDDLREAMQRSGVIDKPDVYILDLADRPSV